MKICEIRSRSPVFFERFDSLNVNRVMFCEVLIFFIPKHLLEVFSKTFLGSSEFEVLLVSILSHQNHLTFLRRFVFQLIVIFLSDLCFARALPFTL